MKVTIQGSKPITGDNVKAVIDDITKRYGPHNLKIKNLTCYIRLVDENGNLVEVVGEKEQVYTFK